MTDYKQLCAELIQLDDEKPSEYAGAVTYETWRQQWNAAIDRARAALSEPEPKGPTRDEAVAVYTDVMAAHDCQTLGDMAEHFAIAVLARWGRPS